MMYDRYHSVASRQSATRGNDSTKTSQKVQKSQKKMAKWTGSKCLKKTLALLLLTGTPYEYIQFYKYKRNLVSNSIKDSEYHFEYFH